MSTYDVSPLRADWLRSAACATRPGLPWTEDTDTVPEVAVEQMKAVCMACPVRSLCDLYVVALDVSGGFWAGRDRDPELPDRLAAQSVEWLPVKDKRGFLVAEQAALSLLDGAA
jgi:hypothetical protein